MTWQDDPVIDEPQMGAATRALGFTNRAIAETLGAPVDVVNALLLGVGGEEPVAGSRSIARAMRAIPGAQVAQPGDVAASYPERIMEGVGFGAGALLPFTGAAKATQYLGPMAQRVGQTIMAPFTRAPVAATTAEIAAGGGAGAGGLAAEREALKRGVDPRIARALGEVTGGIATVTAPGATVRGVKRIAEALPVTGAAMRGVKAATVPFTESGAKIRASRRLRELTADPEAAAAAAMRPDVSGQTPAIRTGEPRLMALERAARETDPALDVRLAQREAQGREAVVKALQGPARGATPQQAQTILAQQRSTIRADLKSRVDAAEDAARRATEGMAPKMKETQASIAYHDELTKALGAARQQESALWGQVPQAIEVPTANAKSAYARTLRELSPPQRKHMPQAARYLEEGSNIAYRAEETAQNMHGLYSELRSEARAARASIPADFQRARIADNLADAVLKDLESVQDVSDSLRVALDYSRGVNETFRQGRVGKILGYAREGGQAMPPETALGSALGRGGAAAAVSTDELRRAVGASPNAEAAMTDYMRRRFTEYAAPRGELNVNRARDFVRQNSELLDRFPGVRKQIDDVIERGSFAGEVRGTVEAGLAGMEKAPVEKFIGAKFAREFESILSSQDPAKTARALAQRAARDETGIATRGLKAAASDFIMRQSDMSGQKILQMMQDERIAPALRSIYSEPEMGRMTQLAAELERAAQSARVGAAPGGVMADPVNSIISMLGRTFGARMGARAGAGTSGASLLTAHFASRRVQRILQSLTNDTAERLVRDAIEDPELFSALLLQGDVPQNAKRIERRLVEWAIAQGGLATGEKEPLQQWHVDEPIE